MTKEEKKEENNDLIKNNVASITIYALSLATALGFNDLILSIFNSFSWNNHIVAKIIYVLIMFGLTIGLAYYFGTNFKK